MTPAYPAVLEAWWMAAARTVTGASNNAVALAQLEPLVAQLSDGFTKDRAEGFGDYVHDSKALAAYGLFYFPQTYVRLLFQLEELTGRCGWQPAAGATVRIADLGAGTGSAGLAAAARFATDHDVVLTAVERSSASLDLATRIAQERSALWPRMRFDPRRMDLMDFQPGVEEKYDLLLASFALNECFQGKDEAAFDAWMDRATGMLAEGGVLLFSEPAAKETFERFMRFRDRVTAGGRMTILAPCLHQRPCPMRAAGEAFCHEVRWWKPTSSMQSLNRRLFRTIQYLKFCFVAVAHRPPFPGENSAELARLVSPLMELKGRVQCDGCAADGVWRRYEMLTRGLKGAAKHDFLQTARGDVVRWVNPRLLGDGVVYRAEGAVTGPTIQSR